MQNQNLTASALKLNHYLARCGVASRRKAAEMVKSGRVAVNGRLVFVPAFFVPPEAVVTVDGKAVAPERPVYLALHKPIGYTCTSQDRFTSRKVTDLVPSSFGRLFTVGRLDRQSSGLILLTNDGDFAQRLSHPRYQVEKEYEVLVQPRLRGADYRQIRAGVLDAGERLSARKVFSLEEGDNWTLVSLVLVEGKKREIRRLFIALGYRVVSLKRVRIGNIRLGNLPVGHYRQLQNPG